MSRNNGRTAKDGRKTDYGKLDEYSMRYKLPDGFTCEACTLQWYWKTQYHCVDPCDKVRPRITSTMHPARPSALMPRAFTMPLQL